MICVLLRLIPNIEVAGSRIVWVKARERNADTLSGLRPEFWKPRVFNNNPTTHVWAVACSCQRAMRKTLLNVFAISAGLVLTCVPALPHHSFAAEFDANKPMTLTGTVTKVEWMNPHARFYVDVKDDKGVVANWEFELGSPNGLMHEGWTPELAEEGRRGDRHGLAREGWDQARQREEDNLGGWIPGDGSILSR